MKLDKVNFFQTVHFFIKFIEPRLDLKKTKGNCVMKIECEIYFPRWNKQKKLMLSYIS